jgi:hypothetical protein
MMRRIRIERTAQRHRDDRPPVLPLDPRDTDVVRAKQIARDAAETKPRS